MSNPSRVTRQNPATSLQPINTASLPVDMSPPCRSFWVATGGTVEVIAEDDTTVVPLTVGDGTLMPVAVKRFVSVTDAAGIVALF